MTSTAVEANADGLIGPTHSYAGLSPGNLASSLNKGEASNPRAAVLQGLDKMKRLADLGLPQYVLPPHERPNIPFLRSLGFTGSDARVLEQACRQRPARPLIRPAARATFSREGRRGHCRNPLISLSMFFTAPASKLATG